MELIHYDEGYRINQAQLASAAGGQQVEPVFVKLTIDPDYIQQGFEVFSELGDGVLAQATAKQGIDFHQCI